jgi:peroxiredoxin
MRRAAILSLLILISVPAFAEDRTAPGAGTLRARDFVYEDVNPNSPTHGHSLSLSKLYSERGVVLNFIASWCRYCWKELPELQELYASETALIVGVAADEYDGSGRLLQLVDQAQVTIPILLVPKDDIASMERDYNHRILPATYVIDKGGSIRRVFQGLAPLDELLEEIRANLGS